MPHASSSPGHSKAAANIVIVGTLIASFAIVAVDLSQNSASAIQSRVSNEPALNDRPDDKSDLTNVHPVRLSAATLKLMQLSSVSADDQRAETTSNLIEPQTVPSESRAPRPSEQFDRATESAHVVRSHEIVPTSSSEDHVSHDMVAQNDAAEADVDRKATVEKAKPKTDNSVRRHNPTDQSRRATDETTNDSNDVGKSDLRDFLQTASLEPSTPFSEEVTETNRVEGGEIKHVEAMSLRSSEPTSSFPDLSSSSIVDQNWPMDEVNPHSLPNQPLEHDSATAGQANNANEATTRPERREREQQGSTRSLDGHAWSTAPEEVQDTGSHDEQGFDFDTSSNTVDSSTTSKVSDSEVPPRKDRGSVSDTENAFGEQNRNQPATGISMATKKVTVTTATPTLQISHKLDIQDSVRLRINNEEMEVRSGKVLVVPGEGPWAIHFFRDGNYVSTVRNIRPGSYTLARFGSRLGLKLSPSPKPLPVPNKD